MRLFILLFAFIVIILVSCKSIKDEEIPSIVVNSLLAKFENPTDIDWKKKGDLYQAEFELNDVPYKALINAEGRIFKFKHEVESFSLPSPVISVISSQKHDVVINEAEEVEKDTITLYQIEIEEENFKKKLIITSNGTIADNERYW